MNGRDDRPAQVHERSAAERMHDRSHERDDWAGIDRRHDDPREAAGWLGTYMLANHPELGWGKCRILDVSASGSASSCSGRRGRGATRRSRSS